MNRPLTDDDAALLRRYRRGDAAAFAKLYQRHRLGLFRFLLGLCGDHALAEEVFQDTWMSLIRSQSEQREAVLRILRGRLSCEHEIADLAQEAFARVLRYRSCGMESLKFLLLRVTLNLVV